MVACQAAVGKQGPPGEDAPPADPAKSIVAPRLIEAIPDQSLMETGPLATTVIDVTANFDDPDVKEGESLNVTAESDDPTTVTARAAGMQVTLTAVKLGETNVTVTVTDKDELTAKGQQPGSAAQGHEESDIRYVSNGCGRYRHT